MKTMNELLKSNNQYEQMIATHIINYSFQNNWDKVEQSQKGISDCMKYIQDRARKVAVGNVAMVEDKEVYQWAIDFYEGTKSTENKSTAKQEVELEEKELLEGEQLSLFM